MAKSEEKTQINTLLQRGKALSSSLKLEPLADLFGPCHRLITPRRGGKALLSSFTFDPLADLLLALVKDLIIPRRGKALSSSLQLEPLADIFWLLSQINNSQTEQSTALKQEPFADLLLALIIAHAHVHIHIRMFKRRRDGNISLDFSRFVSLYNTNFMKKLKCNDKCFFKHKIIHLLFKFSITNKITQLSTERKGWSAQ